jgi:tetratricopeptide (TPR) repeat protein/DNA-binding XRE family transcriptional regulator
MDKPKKPNKKLQHERELHGWSQARVAEKLGTTVKRVSMWECGDSVPDRYYQEKFCDLFGKNAEELGLIERQEVPDSPRTGFAPFTPSMHLPDDTTDGKRDAPLLVDVGGYTGTSSPEDILVSKRGEPLAVVQGVPVILLHAHQAIDLLRDTSAATPEQKLGVLLALAANEFAPFFEEGWSVEELLETLRTLLPGAQAMSKFSRRTFGRKLLKLGTAAILSGIPIPEGRHVSVEELTKLHSALSACIQAGWKLFHTAGNAQVLAVGHAQLYLIQQNHALLSSRERSMFYSSVYNLMGKAMHLQGHYQQALDAHVNAHVAAMATGDPWYVSQSLICQADSYQALGQHTRAIEAIEEALRIVGSPTNELYMRSKAQLLASWADNAITLKEWNIAEEKLEASALLLDQIHPNEQFDHASWLQLKGKYAFEIGDYSKATEHLEAALRKISPNWIVRQVLILLPMVAAYTWQGDRDACLATANTAFSAIKTLNAPTVNNLYATSLQGLLEEFPNDTQVQTFVADKLPQLYC